MDDSTTDPREPEAPRPRDRRRKAAAFVTSRGHAVDEHLIDGPDEADEGEDADD